MRNRGTCTELVHLRPHDHIGWVFSGDDEFTSLGTSFLAEGVARGERLMYVSESPSISGVLGELVASVGPDHLQVASIAEVYGPTGLVDADGQRATFAGALAEALADGYTGIRVAADNTSLVADEQRRVAWMQWELVADGFMAQSPVTGLCAFDRERVDVGVLRHLSTLHPLSNAASPTPQFRLFLDDGALWVEGDVNTAAIQQAMRSLEHMTWVSDVIVDLSSTSFVTSSLKSNLRELSSMDVDVTVLGVPDSDWRAPTSVRR